MIFVASAELVAQLLFLHPIARAARNGCRMGLDATPLRLKLLILRDGGAGIIGGLSFRTVVVQSEGLI